MIRILIQQITDQQYTEHQNFIVKSTPTEITEESSRSYGETKREVKCVEEYASKDVQKNRTVTIDLLEQNIPDESLFSLTAVVKAVNNL